MKIAVVIPTKNRYDDLFRAIESIKRQRVYPAEIIIVDQSDTDANRENIKEALSF